MIFFYFTSEFLTTCYCSNSVPHSQPLILLSIFEMPHTRTVHDVILYAQIIIYAYVGILMSLKAFFFFCHTDLKQLPGVVLFPCANRIRGARNNMQFPRLFIARSTNDKNPLDSTRTSPMSTSENRL